jgi:hypothetical protein
MLEIGFLLYTKNKIPQTLNALAFTLTSILFGVAVLTRFYNKKVEKTAINSTVKKNNFFLVILAVLPGIILLPLLSQAYLKYPIDVAQSDVIPTIALMVKRLLDGTYVYAPSLDFGYLLSPTYLPAQWMPYNIAELLQFDYRWISQAIWVIAFLLLIYRLSKSDDLHTKLFVPLIGYFLYITVLNREKPFFTNTVEIMVAGYYIFFIIALNTNKWLPIALALTVCLLSRYSLILWLPLWAFVMWVSGQRRLMLQVTGVTIALIVLIYVIPFLSKDWQSFSHSIAHYQRAAIGEWQHLDKKGLPYSIYNGIGFAHLMYQMEGISLEEKIKLLQKLDVLLCLGTVLLLGIWYWYKRNKIDYRIFLMGSFKIYLTVFLAFIQVPYIYLMVVSVFVSIAIFSEQMAYKTTDYSPSL